jgi:two-component system sensor histidine kinase KdpD
MAALWWRLRSVTPVVLVVVGLIVGTLVVALLEQGGVADASTAYLLVVVLVAALAGTWPAIATAVGAFLVYDVLFIEPRFMVTVADPKEWLNLLLLLVVGVVVGRLAGQERARAETALAREREARALFDVSFALSSRPDMRDALDAVVQVVRREAALSRAWIQVGDAVLADSGGTSAPTQPAVHTTLGRRPGDSPAVWTRVHAPGPAARRTGNDVRTGDAPRDEVYRVAVVAGERTYGSLWAARPRTDGPPNAGATRVLAAAADQVAGALERERLRGDATAAEIARRSEAIKSALLDSVSHDLRTPLAAIRAGAGTLMDPAVEWSPDERRDLARSIDRDAAWLDRLVTNLLDMSRVDAGELRPDMRIHDLADLVAGVIERGGDTLQAVAPEVRVAPDLPPVLVDDVLMSQVVTNVLDNAVKYGGPGVRIRVTAEPDGPERVRLTVQDSGSGVPDEALARIFEKFYRVPMAGGASRRGTGIGLAVVKGLVEAMDGTVRAERSELGGLRITMTMRAAAPLDEGTAT